MLIVPEAVPVCVDVNVSDGVDEVENVLLCDAEFVAEARTICRITLLFLSAYSGRGWGGGY